MVSTSAEAVYGLFNLFLTLGTIVGIVVGTYLLYNLFRYRTREDKPVEGEVSLGELPPRQGFPAKLMISLFLSSVVVLSLIIGTFSTLEYLESPPRDAFEIRVTAFQWGWEFAYPNGLVVLGEGRIPANRPVKFIVTSRDVFHKFGILELGIGIDAIPGKINYYWTEVRVPNIYEIRCFELCGTGHGVMLGKLVVMEPSEFDRWYGSQGGGAK
ncbi:MAG: cytochrome c oxidase subunit II [Thaumarchaeota archaeon]|nr:cytochrome c oxidase subunit II [Candidatus Calditenuaceae archaeon]MDW8186448.1 cytochrome c oxidase subunit II [Nitrososphaerota archaeon]